MSSASSALEYSNEWQLEQESVGTQCTMAQLSLTVEEEIRRVSITPKPYTKQSSGMI